MAASAAGPVINLDLEDSVSPGDKHAGPRQHHRGQGCFDWATKTLSVRIIRGLDHRPSVPRRGDLLGTGPGPARTRSCDPQGSAAPPISYAVDALVDLHRGRDHRCETHRLRGHHRIRSPASRPCWRKSPPSSPPTSGHEPRPPRFRRLQGMATTGIGGTQETLLHCFRRGAETLVRPWPLGPGPIVPPAAPMARSCPWDGPFGDFLRRRGPIPPRRFRSATLGMVGKLGYPPPNRFALANEVFNPLRGPVTEAREIPRRHVKRQKGPGLRAPPSTRVRLVWDTSPRSSRLEVIVRQSEMMPDGRRPGTARTAGASTGDSRSGSGRDHNPLARTHRHARNRHLPTNTSQPAGSHHSRRATRLASLPGPSAAPAPSAQGRNPPQRPRRHRLDPSGEQPFASGPDRTAGITLLRDDLLNAGDHHAQLGNGRRPNCGDYGLDHHAQDGTARPGRTRMSVSMTACRPARAPTAL